MVYDVKADRAGDVPESFHVIVTVPAAIEAPAAGDTNSTSAFTMEAAAQMLHRVAKRMLVSCSTSVPHRSCVIVVVVVIFRCFEDVDAVCNAFGLCVGVVIDILEARIRHVDLSELLQVPFLVTRQHLASHEGYR